MGKEYRARSFKSGNSVAVRMPAALNIEPSKDWVVTERDGEIVLRATTEPKRKFNIDKVWGSATNLKLIDPEDRWFEERELDWGVAGGDTNA